MDTRGWKINGKQKMAPLKFERYSLIDQILGLFLKVIDLSTTNLKVTKDLHGY